MLATLGLIGIAANGLILLLAPVLRPDVDLLRDGLSHYAVGPWGGLQEAGFVAFGIGSAAIGLALIVRSPSTRPGGILLLIAAMGFLGLAIFPMGQGGPMTPLGDLHLTAGTLGVVFQFASVLALLLWPGACTSAGLSARTGWLLAIVAGLSAAGIQLAMWYPELGLPEGLLARLTVLPLLGWWAMVALALRRG
jgi:hypothetical protein